MVLFTIVSLVMIFLGFRSFKPILCFNFLGYAKQFFLCLSSSSFKLLEKEMKIQTSFKELNINVMIVITIWMNCTQEKVHVYCFVECSMNLNFVLYIKSFHASFCKNISSCLNHIVPKRENVRKSVHCLLIHHNS